MRDSGLRFHVPEVCSTAAVQARLTDHSRGNDRSLPSHSPYSLKLSILSFLFLFPSVFVSDVSDANTIFLPVLSKVYD